MHENIEDFSKTVLVKENGIKMAAEKEPVIRKKYSNDLEKILITPGCLNARLDFLAKEIAGAFSEVKELTCLVILKGSVFFAADLIRKLDTECHLKTRLDFIQCASYGNKTVSSGKVDMKMLDSIEAENILLIEDIIDTGKTMQELHSYLKKKGKKFKTCVLLDKGISTGAKVDFIGFKIPKEFVVGYGLDYAGFYRGMPEIAVIKKEAVK